jgi:signal transduction histidine kinase
MKMKKNSGLSSKIKYAFLLQGGLISIAALLSVFFAKIVIEEILIKSAIKQEAAYFWQNYQQDKGSNLPNTSNLAGYFDTEELPGFISNALPEHNGFYEYDNVDEKIVLHISQQDDQKLYLLYNRGQVDSLAAYYGTFPLALVLMVLYLSLWITYKFSRRAISPVIGLARQVNKIDFTTPDLSPFQPDKLPFDADEDMQILSAAIFNLGERLEAFISRERNFTRDASHELRSPLTVINIAADMLLAEQDFSKPVQNSIYRIKRAASDMEELTRAFLLLARETDQALANERVCINDVIKEEIERAHLLNRKKELHINYKPKVLLTTIASDKVLSVLFGNLIRNAVLYTDQGSVDILINDKTVIIKDSGEGIPQQQINDIFKPYYRGHAGNENGHGVGLTIVKRFSDRFNWPISIDSKPHLGTTVEVQFPDSEYQTLPHDHTSNS